MPGGERAIVDIEKIRDYCLNPMHPRGRHKACVFFSALGLTQADAESLRGELLRAAREGEAVRAEADQFGERYTIDFELRRGERGAEVRSGWIVLRRDQILV